MRRRYGYPEGRWLLACALAAGVPFAMSCLAEPWAGILFFGAGAGAFTGLALDGPRMRRLAWAVLTSVAVWAAFPFGLSAGVAGFLAIAAIAYGGDIFQSGFTLVLALLLGGLAGGALVGAFQVPFVRAPRAWIGKSAIGGVLLLPSSLAALYGPAARPCDWDATALFAVIGSVGGAFYGLITVVQAVRDIPATSRR